VPTRTPLLTRYNTGYTDPSLRVYKNMHMYISLPDCNTGCIDRLLLPAAPQFLPIMLAVPSHNSGYTNSSLPDHNTDYVDDSLASYNTFYIYVPPPTCIVAIFAAH